MSNRSIGLDDRLYHYLLSVSLREPAILRREYSFLLTSYLPSTLIFHLAVFLAGDTPSVLFGPFQWNSQSVDLRCKFKMLNTHNNSPKANAQSNRGRF